MANFADVESAEDGFTLTSGQTYHLDTNNYVVLNQNTSVAAFTAAEYSGAAFYAVDTTNAQNLLNGQQFSGYQLNSQANQYGLSYITLPAGKWYIGVVSTTSLAVGQSNPTFNEISAVSDGISSFIGNVPMAASGQAGSWIAKGFTITGSPDIWLETEGSGGKFMMMNDAQFSSYDAAYANGFHGGSYSYLYAFGQSSGSPATELEGQLNYPPGHYWVVWLNDTGTWQGGAANLSAFSTVSQSYVAADQTIHPGEIPQGGPGDDVITGSGGPDILSGGPGSDTIIGGDGNDHLYGQSANGGPDGADSMSGGNGSDYLQGNAGNDTLDGGDGSDRIQGGKDDDLIIGGTGNDTVNGNLGNDTISGGDGNDSLRGGQGNDSISGDAGNDIIQGDLGQDTLTGGAGSDIFVFTGQSSTTAAPDTITDYAPGADHLSLGFTVAALLTGATQTSLTAASGAAQALFDGHSGDHEAAAFAVGSDTYIFYSSNGGATVDSAIKLAGVIASSIGIGDFI